MFGRFVLAALFFAAPALAEEPGWLRVCADPDNLPFTSADPARRGLYIEYAEALAQELGRKFEAVWWRNFYVKRAIRQTLFAGQCDAYLGLPHDSGMMGPRLIFSKPILDLGYALVLSKEAQNTRLDELQGKKVGVQFGSPPQNLLAVREGYQSVTFLTPEAAMDALAAGRIDAAFIWGPSAGYYNKTALNDRFRVLPVADEGMHWPAAIGFARRDAALRDQVDQVLERLALTLDALQDKYGFLRGKPIKLTAAETAGKEKETRAGRDLFNNHCSHCHGTNAESPLRQTDLRRLRLRYGESADETFATTVRNGRPTKGMAAWGNVLKEAEIALIKKYIDGVQVKE